MSAVSRRKSAAGFTLVEILIVVIILGILAAIVIPQFTDASTSAKKNSLSSQVQTVRSQLELFKSAHATAAANSVFAGTGTAQWDKLMKKTDADGTVNTTSGAYGPYLQTIPQNNLNGYTGVIVSTTAIDDTSTVATGSGWVYDQTTQKFFGTAQDSTKIWVPPSN